MRILVIANPIAGGGAGRAAAERLGERLRRRGDAVEIHFTRAAGDGARRAADIDPTLHALVVVGGDGTLNEVINGLPAPDVVPIIPYGQGTANMLVRELGLPEDPDDLIDVIMRRRERRVDMGTIARPDGERARFLLIVSSGFDAMVTAEVKRRRTGALGFRGYVLPILNVVRTYRAPRLSVTLDGEETLHGAMVVVSNTRNYGGVFSMTDRAELDSGRFDLCVFEVGTLRALLYFGLAAMARRVRHQPGVQYRTARRVRIEGERPVAVEMDGDYFCETPVALEVHPSAVRLIVPGRRGEAQSSSSSSCDLPMR